MKKVPALPIALSLLIGSVAFNTHAATAAAGAPAAPPTRNQVRMERDEFLRTHQWNETSDVWTLKSGVLPPAGVKSRTGVKAARDEFLRNNKWDESAGGWRPLKAAPRDIGGMSREQVRAKARSVMRTHTWDEATEAWVARATALKLK